MKVVARNKITTEVVNLVAKTFGWENYQDSLNEYMATPSSLVTRDHRIGCEQAWGELSRRQLVIGSLMMLLMSLLGAGCNWTSIGILEIGTYVTSLGFAVFGTTVVLQHVAYSYALSEDVESRGHFHIGQKIWKHADYVLYCILMIFTALILNSIRTM